MISIQIPIHSVLFDDVDAPRQVVVGVCGGDGQARPAVRRGMSGAAVAGPQDLGELGRRQTRLGEAAGVGEIGQDLFETVVARRARVRQPAGLALGHRRMYSRRRGQSLARLHSEKHARPWKPGPFRAGRHRRFRAVAQRHGREHRGHEHGSCIERKLGLVPDRESPFAVDLIGMPLQRVAVGIVQVRPAGRGDINVPVAPCHRHPPRRPQDVAQLLDAGRAAKRMLRVPAVQAQLHRVACHDRLRKRSRFDPLAITHRRSHGQNHNCHHYPLHSEPSENCRQLNSLPPCPRAVPARTGREPSQSNCMSKSTSKFPAGYDPTIGSLRDALKIGTLGKQWAFAQSCRPISFPAPCCSHSEEVMRIFSCSCAQRSSAF